MGYAAYERGTKLIRCQIDRDFVDRRVQPAPCLPVARKPKPQKGPRPTRSNALRWAKANCESFFDGTEINVTDLAESIAHEFGRDDWLDDETHWVHEVAVDAEEAYFGQLMVPIS